MHITLLPSSGYDATSLDRNFFKPPPNPMTTSHPIRLLVHGARGKMGARIVDLARQDVRFNVVAAHDVDDAAQADAIAVGSIDAVIDFSSTQGARHATELALKHRAALLIGTTGLPSDFVEFSGLAARSIPVMIAPNTSLGVAVLAHLAAEAARLLGNDFDIQLIDDHHAAKRDAPSGTALRLRDALRQKTGVELPLERIKSIRQGDTIGRHTIIFSGPEENLEILHSATSRDLFARGALRAAVWLHGKAPGRYTVEQSFGLG